MKNKGQMLIEVIVAVGILALVLIGVSDLMTRSARLLSFQRDRDEAYTIARELLNQYREERDQDQEYFFNNVSGLSREVCVVDKKFGCRVDISEAGGGILTKASVFWYEGGKKYEISLEQILTKK